MFDESRPRLESVSFAYETVITEVKVVDAMIERDLEYRPYKKNFFGADQLEGFYELIFMSHIYYSQKDLETKGFHGARIIVSDNVAYKSPQVIVYFSNGNVRYYYCDSYEDAVRMMNKIKYKEEVKDRKGKHQVWRDNKILDLR